MLLHRACCRHKPADLLPAQCWFLLTILTAFSFRPLRNRFYEFFYWSHVILVILVLVTAIIHHKVRSLLRLLSRIVLTRCTRFAASDVLADRRACVVGS